LKTDQNIRAFVQRKVIGRIQKLQGAFPRLWIIGCEFLRPQSEEELQSLVGRRPDEIEEGPAEAKPEKKMAASKDQETQTERKSS
jgi:hypothetical protein